MWEEYPDNLEEIRKAEFPLLWRQKCSEDDAKTDDQDALGRRDDGRGAAGEIRAGSIGGQAASGMVYLDHAGATLYTASQVRRQSERLLSGVYGNPHSSGPAAAKSALAAQRARNKVLAFFGVDSSQYSVVFTSGATASMKLIAEQFPWHNGGTFYHPEESHTSLLGIRAVASDTSARVHPYALSETAAHLERAIEWEERCEDDEKNCAPSLFSATLECNFSGERVPEELLSSHLQLLERQRKKGLKRVFVLLDAAKFVATNTLNLSRLCADFISVSFYKMFGMPTGVGALLVRNSSAYILEKKYFGGGTIAAASRDFYELTPGISQRLEDGTLSFLSFESVCDGIELLRSIGMHRIASHTSTLSRILRERLVSMMHGNGAPCCEVYSLPGSSIVSFNLLRPDGKYIGYSEVVRAADRASVQIRGGCFCNTGACQKALRISPQEALRHFKEGHVCGDNMDIIDGVPTGALRVSIGYMTTADELEYFVDTVVAPFVASAATLKIEAETAEIASKDGSAGAMARITAAYVYPIKSCAAFQIQQKWPITSDGRLLHDRRFALATPQGDVTAAHGTVWRVLRQKDTPLLAKVVPTINVQSGVLTLSSPIMGEKTVSITLADQDGKDEAQQDQECLSVYTCGQLGTVCRSQRFAESLRDAEAWFSSLLGGKRCIVLDSKSITQQPVDGRGESFANYGRILVVNERSVRALRDRMDMSRKSRGKKASGLLQAPLISTESFRPNLVIDGGSLAAFEEDMWEGLSFEIKNGGGKVLRLSDDGSCSRCVMINHEPKSGQKIPDGLRVLASLRQKRCNDSVEFGRLMRFSQVDGSDAALQVGSELHRRKQGCQT
eukprot:g1867.t1